MLPSAGPLAIDVADFAGKFPRGPVVEVGKDGLGRSQVDGLDGPRDGIEVDEDAH